MSAEIGADQESARAALLTMGKALAPREPSGDSARPMPSAALEALKMACLSGENPEEVLKRFAIGAPREDQPACSEPASELAAELAGEIRRACAKMDDLESRQRDLADRVSALDQRLSELEADRGGTRTD